MVEDVAISNIISRLKNNGIKLAVKDYFRKTLKVPGFRSHKSMEPFLSLWVKFTGAGPFAYTLGKKGIPCITIESSWRDSEEKRVLAQITFLKSWIEII